MTSSTPSAEVLRRAGERARGPALPDRPRPLRRRHRAAEHAARGVRAQRLRARATSTRSTRARRSRCRAWSPCHGRRHRRPRPGRARNSMARRGSPRPMPPLSADRVRFVGEADRRRRRRRPLHRRGRRRAGRGRRTSRSRCCTRRRTRIRPGAPAGPRRHAEDNCFVSATRGRRVDRVFDAAHAVRRPRPTHEPQPRRPAREPRRASRSTTGDRRQAHVWPARRSRTWSARPRRPLRHSREPHPRRRARRRRRVRHQGARSIPRTSRLRAGQAPRPAGEVDRGAAREPARRPSTRASTTIDLRGRLRRPTARVLGDARARSTSTALTPSGRGPPIDALMAGGAPRARTGCRHYRVRGGRRGDEHRARRPVPRRARPAATFVMSACSTSSRARSASIRVEIRRRNLIRPDELPVRVGHRPDVYDSASYRRSSACVEAIGYDDFAAPQQARRGPRAAARHRLRRYNELTALGPARSAPRVPIAPATSGATVRMDPSGEVIVQVSSHVARPGHETALAQIVADELGVPIEDVTRASRRHRVDAVRLGTFASRSAVLAGGAAIRAARARCARRSCGSRPGAGGDAGDLEMGTARRVAARPGAASPSPTSRAGVPPAAAPARGHGAGARRGRDLRRAPGTGTSPTPRRWRWSRSTPRPAWCASSATWWSRTAARIINPLVVDGQMHGGVAQGIGGALLEEFVYDDDGQLLTDHVHGLPAARARPTSRRSRSCTSRRRRRSPSTASRAWARAARSAPGPAIASAVEDALRPIGKVFVNELPLTPERVRQFVEIAEKHGNRA